MRIAILFAFEYPKFSLFRINFTFGNSSATISADPSRESLSTTQTSRSYFVCELNTDRKHCRNFSLVLKLTIMTDKSMQYNSLAPNGERVRVMGEVIELYHKKKTPEQQINCRPDAINKKAKYHQSPGGRSTRSSAG